VWVIVGVATMVVGLILSVAILVSLFRSDRQTERDRGRLMSAHRAGQALYGSISDGRWVSQGEAETYFVWAEMTRDALRAVDPTFACLVRFNGGAPEPRLDHDSNGFGTRGLAPFMRDRLAVLDGFIAERGD
jgi:hypothetical protein